MIHDSFKKSSGPQSRSSLLPVACRRFFVLNVLLNTCAREWHTSRSNLYLLILRHLRPSCHRRAVLAFAGTAPLQRLQRHRPPAGQRCR